MPIWQISCDAVDAEIVVTTVAPVLIIIIESTLSRSRRNNLSLLEWPFESRVSETPISIINKFISVGKHIRG